MDKATRLAGLSDVLWIVLSALVAGTWNVLLLGHVNTWIHWYFSFNIFIALVYGWWFVQLHQSPLVRGFWGKLPFLFINIPLFFVLLNKIGFFTNLFDAYLYIPDGRTEPYIFSQYSLETVLFIKRSGIFWAVAAMVSTVLMSLRFVAVIFAHKQIPLQRFYR